MRPLITGTSCLVASSPFQRAVGRAAIEGETWWPKERHGDGRAVPVPLNNPRRLASQGREMRHSPTSFDPPASAWSAAEPLPETSPRGRSPRRRRSGRCRLHGPVGGAPPGRARRRRGGAGCGGARLGASGRMAGRSSRDSGTIQTSWRRSSAPDMGRRMWQITGGAADFVFELIARHKIACQGASVRLDQRGAERGRGWRPCAPTEAVAAARRARGSVGQTARSQKLTGTTCYAGGMLDRRAGALQPLAYVRGLASAAKTAGASIHGRSAARTPRSAGREHGAW